MSRQRGYFATRRGFVERGPSLDALKGAVQTTINALTSEGLFQMHLGFECVDAGFVPGDVGNDVAAYAFYHTGVQFWPLSDRIEHLAEYELFTALEFFHDHASMPIDPSYHSYAGCGIHVIAGDDDAGQIEFRARVNALLSGYGEGYKLSEQGELWSASPFDVTPEPRPLGDAAVDDRVTSAIATFRNHRANSSDRLNAVRELADVLEYLKGTIGTQLPRQDEDRLFEIANQYAIRHHNVRQKTDYDNEIWLPWIFQAYVSAIDVALKLTRRAGEYETIRCPACHQLALNGESWAEVDSDGAMSGGNFKACTNCSWSE